MAVKTYGTLTFNSAKNTWDIVDADPHVWIMLKNLFEKIPKYARTYSFENTPRNCCDLEWFMVRYPMAIKISELQMLIDRAAGYRDLVNRAQAITMPGYVARPVALKDGKCGRNYQLQSTELFDQLRALLLADDLGLGKTVSGMLTCLLANTLPCLVVVPTHLVIHWTEKLQEFTNLSFHVVKKTKPYDLPSVDVYIITYSKLSGWVNVFGVAGFIWHLLFDEVQDLRCTGSNKYEAAVSIREAVQNCMALSATPIYNFGGEIYNIMNVVKPGCLGKREDFYREWCSSKGNNKWVINDPDAFGTYLRDSLLMLRRTRKDVQMELPKINVIIETVGYDEEAVQEVTKLAEMLAMRITAKETSFAEKGEAAREMDLRVRHTTGVSKAKYVALYVKLLLESGEPVLLSGWHLDVYSIWQHEFRDYEPAWYTGNETPAQKQAAKQRFCKGETKLMIISNRSGSGLDGLQNVCSNLVIGELDWSPEIHKQLIGRIDRPGQKNLVNVFYPVSTWGSDPPIISLLALKSSQSHGIMNPSELPQEQTSDISRVKLMAEFFLKNKKQLL